MTGSWRAMCCCCGKSTIQTSSIGMTMWRRRSRRCSWRGSGSCEARRRGRKYAKGEESVGYQRFPPLFVSSHAGGHRFESGSLRKKLLISYEVRSFLRLRIPPSAAPAGLGGTRTFRRHHHLFCILIPQQRKQIIFALSLQSLQSAELIRWASFLEPQLFCRWL